VGCILSPLCGFPSFKDIRCGAHGPKDDLLALDDELDPISGTILICGGSRAAR
jgi:hypothetical protein